VLLPGGENLVAQATSVGKGGKVLFLSKVLLQSVFEAIQKAGEVVATDTTFVSAWCSLLMIATLHAEQKPTQ